MKKPIDILKKYFGCGKYPSEEQFADVLDSYHHKDESLNASDISGLVEVLNNKFDNDAGKALGKQVGSFDTKIAQLSTSVDNAFVLIEEGVDNDEQHQIAINLISDILCSGSTPEQTKAALVALGNGYRDLYTIASTLKTFLESADTADTTINTWREIETFLQGITDISTLTSLLAEVESNIRNSMSAVATSGNYNDLTNKPSLSKVATSGNYQDLSNKPVIPSVWTGTQAQYNAIVSKDSATLYFIV